MSTDPNTDVAAVYLPPAGLVPWDKNPRRIAPADIDRVARSITEFGFAAPIVARRGDNRVIVGHTRLAAAIKLGLAVVPVRLLDVTDEQATRLAIADNRIAEHGAWDDALLRDILRDLAVDAIPLDALGFTDTELDRLIQSDPPPDPVANGAAGPASPPPPPVDGAGPGGATTDYVDFVVSLRVLDRATVYDAIRHVKQERGLASSGVALLLIVRGYIAAHAPPA